MENWDITVPTQKQVDRRTKFGAVISLLMIPVLLAYLIYIIYVGATASDIVANEISESSSKAFSITLRCIVEECYVKSTYVSSDCSSYSNSCKKIAGGDMLTMNMCYTSDPIDGFKIWWPQSARVLNSQGNAYGAANSRFGTGFVANGVRYQLHKGSYIMQNVKYIYNTNSTTIEKWYASPTMVDVTDSDTCDSLKSAGAPTMTNSSYWYSTRLYLAPTYITSTVSRPDVWASILGQFGGFYSLVFKAVFWLGVFYRLFIFRNSSNVQKNDVEMSSSH